MDLEELLKRKLPGLETVFQKATYSPAVFIQLMLYVVVFCNQASIEANKTKMFTEMEKFSIREGKSGYDSDVGRQMKKLRPLIVNSCFENSKKDVFGMIVNGAEYIPRWLNDVLICDFQKVNTEKDFCYMRRNLKGRPSDVCLLL